MLLAIMSLGTAYLLPSEYL